MQRISGPFATRTDGAFGSPGRVFALRVVVSFDESEDLGAGIVLVKEAAALQHLGFECANEGFRPSIVVGIGTRRHALLNVRLAQ